MRDLSVEAIKYINNRKIDKNFPNQARAVEDIIEENKRYRALLEKHDINPDA